MSYWETDTMWEDPIVAEIHKVREATAEKFNCDIDAYFADLQAREASSGRQYVSGPPSPEEQARSR